MSSFLAITLAGLALLGADRVVVPFGCPLDSTDCDGPSCPEGCNRHPLSEWPDASESERASVPLGGEGPYGNGVGAEWVSRINVAYIERRAAGLSQDTFRSFDGNHSYLKRPLFPTLEFARPWTSYHSSCRGVFMPRITMGVQSYGVRPPGDLGLQGGSMIELNSRHAIRAAHSPDRTSRFPTENFYRTFYENNFFLVAPAAGSFTPEKDTFTFLSPFYLHSIGWSYTDATLLTPLVYASAALPPDVKTRIMRKGVFVPTMMYLFKSHIAGDLRSAAAHVPAYTLPEEAEPDYKGEAPFLDGMLNAARGLTHIPPIARLKFGDITLQDAVGHDVTYFAGNAYSFVGALKRGQTFVLTIDLEQGWTDEGQAIATYFSKKLRGAGKIERLNDQGSLLKVTIPWSVTQMTHDYRSDFLFLINDGTYDSAPAYISIRHLQRIEPIIAGIKIEG